MRLYRQLPLLKLPCWDAGTFSWPAEAEQLKPFPIGLEMILIGLIVLLIAPLDVIGGNLKTFTKFLVLNQPI